MEVKLNTQMSPQEIATLNRDVDAFNARLKEDQKVVSKNALGEADFMKLLITQLKSQDPTKPMDDKEFISQMAQFTSLKQMNQLSDSMKDMGREYAFTRAVGLVNKTITYKTETGQMSQGIVESVKVKNGETLLNIDGQEVALSSLQEVRDPMGSAAFNRVVSEAAVPQAAAQAAVQPSQVLSGAAQSMMAAQAAASYRASESAGYSAETPEFRGLTVAAQAL